MLMTFAKSLKKSPIGENNLALHFKLVHNMSLLDRTVAPVDDKKIVGPLYPLRKKPSHNFWTCVGSTSLKCLPER